MILELYFGFFFISFFLLCYGYYTKTDMYCYLGTVFMMLLALMLIPGVNSILGSVEYLSGTASTISGGGTSISVVNQYTIYTSKTLGLYLFIAGIFGTWIINIRGRNGDN